MDDLTTVHLVTFYSDRRYQRAAHRLSRQARDSSLFTSVIIWNPSEIKRRVPERYKRLEELRSSSAARNKGYGLWYWKPVVVEESLKILPAKSILVYLDAGCFLNLRNSESLSRFHDYLYYTKQYGSLAMQLRDGEFGIEDLSEATWTSKKVLDELKVPVEMCESNQVQAGIQFLVVNAKNLKFVSKWRESCERNNFSNLLGEISDIEVIDPSHRYDQSVFSCLYKLEKRFYIPDETFFDPDWQIRGHNFPIWAIRNRDGIDPFTRKMSDIFPRIARKIRLKFKRTV